MNNGYCILQWNANSFREDCHKHGADFIRDCNAIAIKQANAQGFTINASTESIAEADQAFNEGYPTTVVLEGHSDALSTFKTPSGNTVAICPAQLKDNVTCETCALCQKSERKVIVGFIAHGSSKAKVIKILAVKG